MKDVEEEELKRRLHRHRRRRSALQRLEERREEARREEERESQRVREKVLLHQQFRHLYRAERLTSQSTDDASVTFSSRSSIPPSHYASSDPHLLQDSSPEGSTVVQFLQQTDDHNTDEPLVGDAFNTQQEREARLALPHKFISCLPRVEEEATDEEENEELDAAFPPPPPPVRPHSLVTATPGHLNYYDLKAEGQRFSLMSYSDWLRDGTKDVLIPTTHALTTVPLRRARSEPKLPQGGGKCRVSTPASDTQAQDTHPTGTSSGRSGRKGRKEKKRGGARKQGEASSGVSYSTQGPSTSSRDAEDSHHNRNRQTRPKATRKRNRRPERSSSRPPSGTKSG